MFALAKILYIPVKFNFYRQPNNWDVKEEIKHLVFKVRSSALLKNKKYHWTRNSISKIYADGTK